VYTTVDLELQRAAEAAVAKGMEKADALIRKQNRNQARHPEAALVALDPRTGEVKALIGGRNYEASQLNRALAVRQPGSAFKPFVYAAALTTAVAGGPQTFTAATLIDDTPTAFHYKDEVYEPSNFEEAVYGAVTLRRALARSINIATVKLAEMVGYRTVVKLAADAGLARARATPSMALGAYDTTPLELAGAYTVFAGQGTYVSPALISQVRAPDGKPLYTHSPKKRQTLDPRIAFLMRDMLESVINRGTAASARAQGLQVRAAGKTGTSRDGWFAGFTPELVCVVWVGFDDGSDLGLEGSRSALPIWTEFMKHAVAMPRYASTQPFPAPEGIVSAPIDPESGQLATPWCPSSYTEVFVSGTEPKQECLQHQTGMSFRLAGDGVAPASQ
jgi:penicillin-binding protein 1B